MSENMIGAIAMGRMIDVALASLDPESRREVEEDVKRAARGEIKAVQLQCLTLQCIGAAFQALVIATHQEHALMNQTTSSSEVN